ncbi:hypothetical protein SAY87_021903 [Trapa incisa]|uniref:Uncharacterized protein n=1 Tax=Trapa incisa TaxID=236973 RepID=A0AAN7JRP7_9MYRT|nr:hypothetical protein SAY87_021903 [Trapa incisa]
MENHACNGCPIKESVPTDSVENAKSYGTKAVISRKKDKLIISFHVGGEKVREKELTGDSDTQNLLINQGSLLSALYNTKPLPPRSVLMLNGFSTAQLALTLEETWLSGQQP